MAFNVFLRASSILETEGDEHEKERFVKRRVAELQRNMDLENGPLVHQAVKLLIWEVSRSVEKEKTFLFVFFADKAQGIINGRR
jgi:hypothetical protein